VLAKDLYPGNYHPTVSHVFISLLASKGLLHQLFTQNIDCLERAAGIPAELIVEAHGSFAAQRCIECKTPFGDAPMREHVRAGKVPRCERAPECDGLVKPDIVFFGEALPRLFFERTRMAAEADLILVMGTSLQVHPFASLPNLAPESVPRVLFNLERVGTLGSHADDVLVLGDCDVGVRKLADELGWREELETRWRELVGEEEAQRQLQGAKKRVAGLHDEVSKLADEVGELLHLQEDQDAEEKRSSAPPKEGVVNQGPEEVPQTSQSSEPVATKAADKEQPDDRGAPVEASKEEGVKDEIKANSADPAAKAAL
jgi:NAD-dependent histone deacetylase SIR2